MGARLVWLLRAGLIGAALFMIEGGIVTDLVGVGAALAIYLVQRIFKPKLGAIVPVRGAD